MLNTDLPCQAQPRPPVKRVSFAQRVVDWARVHGRHNLPWQTDRSPYRVWVSEVMLQQTQVATVIPYFEQFMARFPNVTALSRADVDEVLHLWSGLGYYSRARNLHAAAKQVADRFGGHFPTDFNDIQSLPGIGRSTAGAIASMALGQSRAILDGNVKRVLARHEAIEGWPGQSTVLKQLWAVAESNTPSNNAGAYAQGMMDLGATLCTRRKPTCLVCPVMEDCKARAQGTPERFPSPRPKKERPLRRTGFVILRDVEGNVLLERRPPTGVWASLWSFPEAPNEAAIETLLARHKLKAPTAVSRLDDIEHGFTHFQLHIAVWLVDVSAPTKALGVADDNDRMWMHPSTPAEVGLAAPVGKLLTGLAEKTNR